MAKRSTDTQKWGKASFSDLDNAMKLFWIFLCDNCDHAGVWDINWRLVEFHLGLKLNTEKVKKAFGDKIVFLSSRKMFLPSFVEFQYGDLKPGNRVHASVQARLEKVGAYKGCLSPLEGAKDKDMEKEEDQEKVKERKKDLVVNEANGGTVIAAYCDAWKARYKSTKSPPITGKDSGAVKTIVTAVGAERAVHLVRAYLQMPDSWFVTKRHDLPTLASNLNAVTQFVETGQMVTRGGLRKLEEKVEETMGPKPRGIAEILAEQEQLTLSGGKK